MIMTSSPMLQRAEALVDEAIIWFHRHPPFVARMEHARRVQVRLVALGVTDVTTLIAARVFPIFPIGKLTMPLLTLSMLLGDEVADAVGAPVAILAEEVAAQLGRSPRGRMKRLPAGVRQILEADRWWRDHKPRTATPPVANSDI